MKRTLFNLIVLAFAGLTLQACVTSLFVTETANVDRNTSPIVRMKTGEQIQLLVGRWTVDADGNLTGRGAVLGDKPRNFDGTILSSEIDTIEFRVVDTWKTTALIAAYGIVVLTYPFGGRLGVR